MKNNNLTHEMLCETLNYNPDTGVFIWVKGLYKSVKSGSTAGATHSQGYEQICINRKRYYSHRLAWFYVNKKWPEYNIDHIDGDTSNNKINNLRDVKQVENARNRHRVRSDSSTGIRGVSRHGNKYRFVATVDKSRKVIGTYDDINAARVASAIFWSAFTIN
jgi:hypothetical protein